MGGRGASSGKPFITNEKRERMLKAGITPEQIKVADKIHKDLKKDLVRFSMYQDRDRYFFIRYATEKEVYKINKDPYYNQKREDIFIRREEGTIGIKKNGDYYNSGQPIVTDSLVGFRKKGKKKTAVYYKPLNI
mgnify:CR=1 FL=1